MSEATIQPPDEYLEKLKEFQRMQFDYFKHLTTLCAGSIAAIVAFIRVVSSNTDATILVGISVILFMACLIVSLCAMQAQGNTVLYITEFSKRLMKKEQSQAEEAYEKISKSLAISNVLQHFSMIFLLFGFASIIFFAGINYILQNKIDIQLVVVSLISIILGISVGYFIGKFMERYRQRKKK